MIVRTVGDTHHIISQMAHARQSGLIATYFMEDYLEEHWYRQEFLHATFRHDDGWKSWEESPVYEESGLPRNFSDIDKSCHIDNWTRGIFTLLHEVGPFAASLIACHALPLVKDKGEETVNYFEELLVALEKRAWPQLDPRDARVRTRRSAGALAVADLVSLVGCAGWPGEHGADLLDADGNPLPITVSLQDPLTVLVDPWPFVLPSIECVPVDAWKVPVGAESQAGALFGMYSTPAERIPLTILPGRAAP